MFTKVGDYNIEIYTEDTSKKGNNQQIQLFAADNWYYKVKSYWFYVNIVDDCEFVALSISESKL